MFSFFPVRCQNLRLSFEPFFVTQPFPKLRFVLIDTRKQKQWWNCCVDLHCALGVQDVRYLICCTHPPKYFACFTQSFHFSYTNLTLNRIPYIPAMPPVSQNRFCCSVLRSRTHQQISFPTVFVFSIRTCYTITHTHTHTHTHTYIFDPWMEINTNCKFNIDRVMQNNIRTIRENQM